MRRPTCKACGKHRPTIGGRCTEHLALEVELWLCTVSAEDVLELEAR